MARDRVKISIPASLYKKIEEEIKDKEKESVADYVVRVVEEALSRKKSEDEGFSKEDEEKVKERLKALGYID
ncbi:MAG: CopG family transcriptional regulator [Candidatus Aminicenantales bacterium]